MAKDSFAGQLISATSQEKAGPRERATSLLIGVRRMELWNLRHRSLAEISMNEPCNPGSNEKISRSSVGQKKTNQLWSSGCASATSCNV